MRYRNPVLQRVLDMERDTAGKKKLKIEASTDNGKGDFHLFLAVFQDEKNPHICPNFGGKRVLKSPKTMSRDVISMARYHER